MRRIAQLLCTLGAWFALVFPWGHAAASPTAAPPGPLRIQLHWVHQAQFAGFYMAQERGLFRREGLAVELIPGGPGVNPAQVVQNGRADVAVAWMSEVWALSRSGPGLIHVAQLAQKSSLGLLCRHRAGIVGLSDLRDAKVGYWGLGDDALVRQMARTRGVDPQTIRFEIQQPDAKDLISGKLPCVTAMAYNEKLLAEAAGLGEQDALWVVPDELGIGHLEDGLYVRRDRLQDPAFQDQMVRLVRALREGWIQARTAPSLALEYSLKRQPGADKEHQRRMLDVALATIPTDHTFGLLPLTTWQMQAKDLQVDNQRTSREVEALWTHQVVNELARREGKERFLRPSTHHYLTEIGNSLPVVIIDNLGAIIMGISGFLVALRAGYGPWGQLVLALVTPLGGGVLRDLLLSGERWPPSFLYDPTIPMIIIVSSMLASAMFRVWPHLKEGAWSKKMEDLSEVAGVSIVSLGGVMIALETNLHWAWALVGAAVSVAGGGILRDLVMNKEPTSLRPGVAVEGAAVAGAAVLVAGASWANHYEHTPWPVYLSMVACALVSMGLLLWSMRKEAQHTAAQANGIM